ncbi:hypothetical protein LSTR_LSTR010519 [Laodelphax striatellus]|uniref:Uncharacterized protein n=1 Tax=Laodelphax striatellus TaxID=195883 RepID=A0A482X3R1_LAOST|nr:hypothetical protein LSTR_LSTR010519 [Laodelphax striatellus]
MAFMVPVVRKDYDIYKQRRISECSNSQTCRSRKVSECSKSEGPSLSTSPGSDFLVGSPAHRSIMLSSRNYSRNSSRTSQSSLQSPSKSSSSSPPKSGSTNSLNKFHNRLVDKLKRSLKSKDSSGDGWGHMSQPVWETQVDNAEETSLPTAPFIQHPRKLGPALIYGCETWTMCVCVLVLLTMSLDSSTSKAADPAFLQDDGKIEDISNLTFVFLRWHFSTLVLSIGLL